MDSRAQRKLFVPRWSASALLIVSLTVYGTPCHVQAAGFGTIQGTVTDPQGNLLNGICGHLINRTYTTDVIDFAGSGVNGQPGFYTQANVPPGHYLLLFTDCGGNVNGGPIDNDFVPTFYGGGINPTKATPIGVPGNTITTLGPQQIALGGTVTGTVKDATTRTGADTIAVGVGIPGDTYFNLSSPFSWLIVCSDSSGNYSVSGVPTTGVRIVAAPSNWGCFNGQGTYNGNFWNQSVSKVVNTTADGTVSGINLTVTEMGTAAMNVALTISPQPGAWKLVSPQ